MAIIMIHCNPWSFFINSSVSPFSLFIVYDLSIPTIVEEQTMGKIIFIFILYSHFSHTNKVSQIIFIVCSIFLFWQQWDTMRNMTLFIYARLFNIVKNQQQQQRWEYSRLKCIAIRELLPKYSPLLLSNKRNICLKNDGLQHRIIHDGIFFSLKSTLCLKWIVIFFETPGNMFCDHEKVSTFYTKRFFRVIYTR